MFLLFTKACLLDKTSKIVFSRFITWEYRGLQGVPRSHKGLQRVRRGDRGVTRGYRVLQRIIETFF